MSKSAMAIPYLDVIFIFLLVNFFSCSLSDPRATLVEISCENLQEGKEDEISPKFDEMMKVLNSGIANNRSAKYSIDGPTHLLMGLAQCHNDLSSQDCHECFSVGQERLRQCLPSDAGRVYLDGCFIRYDHYDFFNESVVKYGDVVKCDELKETLSDNYIQKELFDSREEAIRNVTAAASGPGGSGFGTAVVKDSVESAYGLGQCWSTIGPKECGECLKNAGDRMQECWPGADARAMNAGCFLRVSYQKFFNWVPPDQKKNDYESIWSEEECSKTLIVVLTVVGAFVLSLLSFFCSYISYKKFSKVDQEDKTLVKVSSSINNSSLHYKYETLEQATGKFDPSNKLGQGAGGSVFKGTLSDGKIVAVKRLYFTTRQWADDFFNEVNLIHGVHHKNLVRILGCSIEGPESLIVYEFVPNKSLNQILFDKNKTETLSWKQRFDIIMGIAEGLAYLHEGCGTKIIHRDIKNSNILLDEDLTPKIADFGLVRRVAPDRTHVSTAVAGTLGYMAPEYLLRGHLTEKADVYAFGVLAIEISCGRKNNVFMDESNSILQSVWKSYKSGKITESVDGELKADFDEEEASKALQVGLLCTQTSPGLRPSMTEAVQMFKKTENDSAVVPPPQQPPFLNSSLMESDGGGGDEEVSSKLLSETTSSQWHSSVDVLSGHI